MIDTKLHRLLVWWCEKHLEVAAMYNVDRMFIAGDDKCCNMNCGKNEVIVEVGGKLSRCNIGDKK